MKHLTMITGATSGIGEACAIKFASHGHDLILTGRRCDRLNKVANSLRENYGVRVMECCFDVRDKKAVTEAWESLPTEWQQVEILVNNAGLALGREAFQNGNPDDWEQMIDTNVKGIFNMTHQVLPNMISAQKGHVINIGSVAGRETYAGGNVYCASKFAVEGFSRALRVDLAPHGVKVSTVSPGMVDTEFSLVRFKGDKEKAESVYQGFQPLTATDIAEAVWFIASQPAHVCINDVNLTCTAQANSSTVFRKQS